MDDNYWLKRVITKLYAKLLSNNVLGNWTPDEESPEQESRALDTLEMVRIIDSPGEFEGGGNRIVSLSRGGNPRSAPNRQIIRFDYDKFMHFCETNGFDPAKDGTVARLEVADGVQPIVYVEDDRYPLTAMDSSGLPQKVVAFAWKNPNRRISLDELRQNIDMTQIKKDDASLTQTFDKKNIFGKNGILKAFAEIEVRSFLLKQSTSLTLNEVEAIKKASNSR